MKFLSAQKYKMNRPVNFGKVMKRYLDSNDISIQQFAEDVGVQREYAYSLLKKPIFSMDMTLRICEVYQFPISFFIKTNSRAEDQGLHINNMTLGGDSADASAAHKHQERIIELMEKNEVLHKEISSLKDRIIKMLDKNK